MAGFNLTAQLQLQAPTNTSQVVSNIKKQLSNVTANVQVKGDARSLAQINKQMQGVSKSASASSKSVSNLNRNLSEYSLKGPPPFPPRFTENLNGNPSEF